MLRVMTSCSLVATEASVVFLYCLEDGGRKFLRNLSNSLEKTWCRPRRLQSLKTVLFFSLYLPFMNKN